MKWIPIFKTKAEKKIAAKQKEEAMGKWHVWFAWHPVRVKNKAIWLERVLRRGEPYPNPFIGDWKFEYTESVFDLLKLDPTMAQVRTPYDLR